MSIIVDFNSPKVFSLTLLDIPGAKGCYNQHLLDYFHDVPLICTKTFTI